jgi:two-component system cell cycle sensor histidine kinase/response regulator CckA
MASPLDELLGPLQGTLFPIQVLLVDGDAEGRAEARDQLERLGYSVIATDTADAALRLLHETHVPVDLLVTVLDPGDAQTAEVRRSWPELPVLFLSDEPGLAELPEPAGARAGVLLKPFAADDLRETVVAVLSGMPAR